MAYKEVEPIIKKLDDEMKSESKAWSDYDKSMIDIGLRVAIDIIKEQPTADVVEVVRCEKCKYGDVSVMSKSKDGKEDIACYCNLENKVRDIDWYCPSGKRREHNG